MIGGMPAAAPDHAPRPRVASWLMAGAVVVAVGAVLALTAWFGAPVYAPVWVRRYSPWVGPVMRTGIVDLPYPTDSAPPPLAEWIRNDPQRCIQLVPYLSSTDHRTRLVVVDALVIQRESARPVAVDAGLLPLLDDEDAEIRREAADAMGDVGSIPALEAHRHDPDHRVSAAIAAALDRLHMKLKAP